MPRALVPHRRLRAPRRTAPVHLAPAMRDLIIRGGENIYPFEIENRLDEHPEVDRGRGVRRRRAPCYGQEVKAVVVVRDTAEVTDDELQAFCATSSRRTRCRRRSRSAPSRCRAPRRARS